MKIQSLLSLETQAVATVLLGILLKRKAGNSAKAFCLNFASSTIVSV